MEPPAYLPRVVDRELVDQLAASPIVVLEGPKACGKTSTARQVAASDVRLDVDEGARRAARLDPALVLEGPTPRLIDEWQLEPGLWNHVRRAADDRGRPGQFILCGSAVPADDATRHTGAGRIARIGMRPMSLRESGHSSGAVSLSGLLAGSPPRAADTGLSVAALADRIALGGWPGFRALDAPAGLRAVAGYVGEIVRTDINRVKDGDRRDRDPARVLRLLRSLARNVATAAAVTTLAADSGNGEEGPVARNTASAYLAALERLMIVEDQPAWSPHLRSRRQLRTTAKRHFVDPSLAVAALGASPERLLADLGYLGLLFESLVIRDLRVYGQAEDATVTYYADNTGLEVDAIVQTRDGRWAAFEVKLGGDQAIEAGAASLLRFHRHIDAERAGEPGCLGVIVASGYGYVRDDGVAVIPIGALGP